VLRQYMEGLAASKGVTHIGSEAFRVLEKSQVVAEILAKADKAREGK
jgi:hypothetical protein